MSKIVAVSTAVPPHLISQGDVKKLVKKIFNADDSILRFMPIFDHAMVGQRYFSVGLEWFGEKHSFTEVNDLYIKTAVELSEEAILKLTAQCEVRVSDFDIIFFISTTGLSTPSIDARLFNRIGLHPHIKRVPIWGLGCAGGAAGLARAHDYLKSYPTHRALIVAVELCGLAFQMNDYSKSNIISTAIFGEGAAACMMVGDDVVLPDQLHGSPSVLGSLSTIYPETEDVMSWRVTSDGFKVQLSKDIPSIVTSLVKENVKEMLQGFELPLEKLSHFIMHPGGMKVLQAYAEGLNIPMEKLKHSVDVLHDFGNMSSATVYFVLQRFLESNRGHGEYGLLGSLGPGFSSELLLLQWK